MLLAGVAQSFRIFNCFIPICDSVVKLSFVTVTWVLSALCLLRAMSVVAGITLAIWP